MQPYPATSVFMGNFIERFIIRLVILAILALVFSAVSLAAERALPAYQGAPLSAPPGGGASSGGGYKSDVQLRYEEQRRQLDQSAQSQKTQSSMPDALYNSSSMLDGAYVGGQAGMVMGSSDINYRNRGDDMKQDGIGGNGYLASGYLGIGRSNTKTNLYLGGEADLTLSGYFSETRLNGQVLKLDVNYTYFLNARAGYLVSPQSMAYLKAGVGRMNWDISSSQSLDYTDTRLGLLMGLGFEHMIKDKISLRSEVSFTKWTKYKDRVGSEEIDIDPLMMNFFIGASYHF